jgi:methanogenic corrinoid protein MtbC1
MGWLSAIWEIFKVVAPHAAPHVTQAVRDRRTAREAAERRHLEEAHAERNAEEMAAILVALEQRMLAAESRATAAEERACVLEEKFTQAEALVTRNWATARIWIIWLLAWNAVVTAILLYLIFRRK